MRDGYQIAFIQHYMQVTIINIKENCARPCTEIKGPTCQGIFQRCAKFTESDTPLVKTSVHNQIPLFCNGYFCLVSMKNAYFYHENENFTVSHLMMANQENST